MNYNKLLFFIIALGLGSMQLKAQNSDIKENHQIILTKILDEKPVFSSQILLPIDIKSIKMANRHRDLINAIVKSKIECTSDLFIIFNDVKTC